MISKFGKFEFALAEKYRFENELGRGAMGTVYRALDLRLDRLVAIKMLHPMLTDDLGARRFQSEIRIAAGLHHGNIIGVHDSGETDGRLYYVMDYIGGETLRSRLRREKQVSVKDALYITEQVASGLQYAHEHRVVHRDVKPENIILAEGRACIMDFGLARALDVMEGDRLTQSGLSVGTPHYLSPEQAGAEKDVGPAADQYALACVLYEMLAGEPPFTGPTATAIATRHMSHEAPPIRSRRKSVDMAIEAAIARALEKVPADRFASIADFAAELKSAALRSANVSAFPSSPRSRGARTVLSARQTAVLIVSSAVILGASFYLHLRAAPDVPEALSFQLPTSMGIPSVYETVQVEVGSTFQNAIVSGRTAVLLKPGRMIGDSVVVRLTHHDGGIEQYLAVRKGSTFVVAELPSTSVAIHGTFQCDEDGIPCQIEVNASLMGETTTSGRFDIVLPATYPNDLRVRVLKGSRTLYDGFQRKQGPWFLPNQGSPEKGPH